MKICIIKKTEKQGTSTRRRRRAVKLISFDYSMLLLLCGLTWQSHVYRLCTLYMLLFCIFLCIIVCSRARARGHKRPVPLCMRVAVWVWVLIVLVWPSHLTTADYGITTFVRTKVCGYMYVTLANQSRIYSLTRSYTHRWRNGSCKREQHTNKANPNQSYVNARAHWCVCVVCGLSHTLFMHSSINLIFLNRICKTVILPYLDAKNMPQIPAHYKLDGYEYVCLYGYCYAYYSVP